MLVSNYLCIHVICILIVWNSLINLLYLDIKIICLTATYNDCIYNRLLLNILYVINQKYGLNL